MFRWINAEDELDQAPTGSTPSITQDVKTPFNPKNEKVYRFAAEHDGNEVRLYLDLALDETDAEPFSLRKAGERETMLVSDEADAKPLTLSLRSNLMGCRLEITPGPTSGSFRVCVIVPRPRSQPTMKR
jgi:hypothetical protein